MKTTFATITCVLAPVLVSAVLAAQQQPAPAATSNSPAPPLWAFPVAPAAPRGAGGGGGAGGGRGAAAPADTAPKSVPGSTVTLTPQQVRDTTNIPTGIRTVTRLCPALFNVEEPVPLRAATVICPTARGGLRIPVSRDCPRSTSSSRWRISRRVCGRVPNPGWGRRISWSISERRQQTKK